MVSLALLVNHQSQMAFAAHSHDVQTIRNNITGLAKSAKVINVPTTLITVVSKPLSDPVIPER